MAFDPKKLPAKVYDAYKLGPGVWPIVIEAAIQENILDVDRLTSIIFYLHHPERLGRPLKSDETSLIKEWKAFRTIVKSRVDAAAEVSAAIPDKTSEYSGDSKKYDRMFEMYSG